MPTGRKGRRWVALLCAAAGFFPMAALGYVV